MARRVVEFSTGGYKIRKILPKNPHTQRKLLNFENWVNGEVSKIGYHSRKFSCTELVFQLTICQHIMSHGLWMQ